MTEFILYGGKGGVGKTTLAAATGVTTARDDHRTLVVSTDPAHSLADAYGVPVGEEPTPVADDRPLSALEVDPRDRFRDRYGDTFKEVLADAQSVGVDVTAEDVGEVTERGLVPGADELAVVDLFAEYDDHPDWDVIVFDTAPTGHTLRLLSLPDVMNTTVGKLLSFRGAVSSVTTTVRGLFGSAAEGPGYTTRLSRLETAMETVGDRLRDGDRTRFRAVTIPEEMALAETERLLGELDATGIAVEAIFANKVLQDASEDCPTCWPRYQRQQELLDRMRAEFTPPVTEVPVIADVTGWKRVDAVTAYTPGVGGRGAE